MDSTDTSLRCSNDGCLRPWTPAPGGLLPLTPVAERIAAGERRWHPCPECLGDDALVAELSHRVRERTARELAAVTES